MDIHPKRQARGMKAIRADRRHVMFTHNPSTIDPGQTLRVQIPNLSMNDVIIPGSFFISFELTLSSAKDKARSVVPNIGRKIVKTLKIKLRNTYLQTIDNYDEIMTYFDQWLSKKDKSRRISQGIHTSSGLKLRVDSKDATGDVEETAISKTLGSRFKIPIDFELLNDVAPFYQYALVDKLGLELTFNDAKAVILGSTAVLAGATDSDYNYSVSNIRTEWDQITDPILALSIATQYESFFAVPYTRIIHHGIRPIEKTESVVNLDINLPCTSLTHIIILAVDDLDRKSFAHKEIWRNLDITHVSIKIEAQPNNLYAEGLLKENTWTQITKLFHDNGVSMGDFLTEKYALCLDLRPSIDKALHGNGVKLENTTHGISIQIKRVAGTTSGKLNLHIVLLKDEQLNIQGSEFHEIVG